MWIPRRSDPSGLEDAGVPPPALYGARGGRLRHTVYVDDGSEMLVVEDELEPDVSHFVKLLREKDGDWTADDVSRLDDRHSEKPEK